MKRYNCTDSGSSYESYGEPIMQESPTGDYVKYEDVQKLVEALKEIRDARVNSPNKEMGDLLIYKSMVAEEALKELDIR